MIKTTNRALFDSHAVLKELAAERGRALSYRDSRYIGVRVLRAAGERLTELERDRLDILKEFGEEFEAGKFRFLPEHADHAKSLLDSLLDEAIELVNVDKLKPEQLEKANLSPGEWLALDWLIEDSQP